MNIITKTRAIYIRENHESCLFEFLTKFELPDDDFSFYIESVGSRYELECLLHHQFVRVNTSYTADQKLEFRCKLLNNKGIKHRHIIFHDCKNFISRGGIFLSKFTLSSDKWDAFVAQYPKNFTDDLSHISLEKNDTVMQIIHRKDISHSPAEPQIRCMLLLLNFIYPLSDLADTAFTIESTDSALLFSKTKK